MRFHDTPAFRARFWSKVDRTGDCWPWTGHCNPINGYGHYTIWVDGQKVTLYAHRIAYQLANGPIPPGIHVRHAVCDNPPCCRPEHLAGGTRAENMADMLRRHRGVWSTRPERMRRGERSHLSRLTEAQVIALRQRFAEGGITKVALGKRFGITGVMVGKIVRGEQWRHLPLPLPPPDSTGS